MSITAVEFKNKKPHLRYDPDKKRWIGYKVDVRINGKRHRPTLRTKGEAERFVAELRSKKLYAKSGLRYEVSNGPTVSKLFAERLKVITDHKAHVRAVRIFDYFKGLLESDVLVTAIRRSHYRLFINARREDGVKNETINREINELSAAFRLAPEIFPNELDDFEAPPIARPKVQRGKRAHREITEAEALAIVTTIRTQRKTRELPQRINNRRVVAWMFELAWLLGLRIGETEKLLKTDRNIKANSLRVVRWKTRSESTFTHLPERVNRVLDEASADSPTDHIFNLTCSRNTIERIVKNACTDIGIPYGRGKSDAITFHSTRHSFTSRLVRVTDMATAGSFTGHSSEEMVDYYAHADEDSRRLAMERMYGKKTDTDMRKIFRKVRAGKMTEAEFLETLK